MNENGNVGCLCSWPIIIIALILFWPVGILLIVWRATKDRKTAMRAGKLLSVLGFVSYVFAAIMVIGGIADGFDGSVFACMIFFIVAGLVLQYVGKRIKRSAEDIRKYLAVIINGNERQLESIAASTGKTYEVVHDDIKKMINKGYFKDAYIDEGLRELVLPEKTPESQNTSTTDKTMNQNHVKVVACSCCGANNTVYGTVGECEYCGAPLK